VNLILRGAYASGSVSTFVVSRFAKIINELSRSIAKICDFEDEFSVDVASVDHLMNTDGVLEAEALRLEVRGLRVTRL